jgi:hypothetical protein
MILVYFLLLHAGCGLCSTSSDKAKQFGYNVEVCTDESNANTAWWCDYLPIPDDALIDVTSSSTDDSFGNLTLFDRISLPFFHEPLFPDRHGLQMSASSNGFLTPAGSTYSPFYDPSVYDRPVIHWPMIALYVADLYPPGSLNNMSSVRYWYTKSSGAKAGGEQQVTSLVWNFDNVPLYGKARVSNLTAQAQLFPNGTVIFRYKSVPLQELEQASVGLVLSENIQFLLDAPAGMNFENDTWKKLTVYGYRLDRTSAYDAECATHHCSSCSRISNSQGAPCAFCETTGAGLCAIAGSISDMCMPGKQRKAGVYGTCLFSFAETGAYNTTLRGGGSIPSYASLARPEWEKVENGAIALFPFTFPIMTDQSGSTALFPRALLRNASVMLLGTTSNISDPNFAIAPLYRENDLPELVPELTTMSLIAQPQQSPFCLQAAPCRTVLIGFWNVSQPGTYNGVRYSYAVELGPAGYFALYYISSNTVTDSQRSDVFASFPAFFAGIGPPILLESIPVVPLLPGRSVVVDPLLPLIKPCPTCYNGGRCNDQRNGCLCRVPFTGPRCETKCDAAPFNCSLCNSTASFCTCTGCLCRVGFQGPTCTPPQPKNASGTSAPAPLNPSSQLFAVATVILAAAIVVPLVVFGRGYKKSCCGREGDSRKDVGPQVALSKALPGPVPLARIDDAALRNVLFPQDSSIDGFRGSAGSRASRNVSGHGLTDKDYEML